MTQDKAPEQICRALMANPPTERVRDEGPPVVVVHDYSNAVAAIMDIVSQAYERGQESMRERAAALVEQGYDRVSGEPWRDDGSPSKLDKCAHEIYGYESCEHCAVAAIRSLPIEQEGGE